MTSYICVECGSQIANLYLESSSNNIRLSRCVSTGTVALAMNIV